MYIRCMECGEIYDRPVKEWEETYGPVEKFICKKCVKNTKMCECDKDGYLPDGGRAFN